MSAKKRSNYPYSVSEVDLTQSYGRPPRKQKRRIRGRHIVLPLLAVVVIITLYSLVFSKLIGKIDFSPFAKTLKALRFHHNGQEVILTPGSQVVVNPRDTLHLLDIQTDGLVSWGTKVAAPDADLGAMMSKSQAIREMLPNEEFETPRPLEITVLQWSRPLGKVSFLVQLDAKDWLQKANATADAAKRIGYLEKALR